MFAITIDHDRCKKDGMCARVCPANIFVQREKLTIPELLEKGCCIACGQCLAICAQGAISHSEFPSGTISTIQFEGMPTTEQVMALLKTRRSIRAFRDEPLEKGAAAKRRGAVEEANWWTVTMLILVSPLALLLGPLG